MEMISVQNSQGKKVILFDGVCNLCNKWVKFVLQRDSKRAFVFTSLQSGSAEKLLREFNLRPDHFDSVILIEQSGYYIKSTASLRILSNLGSMWPLLSIFILVPQGWRDKVYDYVATNRYRWFGKSEQCAIPGPDIRYRFLD